jgi:hypothetical protein
MKHGYVQQVKDWPYSTFHRYVAAGLLTGLVLRFGRLGNSAGVIKRHKEKIGH